MSPSLIGAVAFAVPLALVATFVLGRRLHPVFWFALALIGAGTGYLVATGAAADIGRAIWPT